MWGREGRRGRRRKGQDREITEGKVEGKRKGEGERKKTNRVQ